MIASVIRRQRNRIRDLEIELTNTRRRRDELGARVVDLEQRNRWQADWIERNAPAIAAARRPGDGFTPC